MASELRVNTLKDASGNNSVALSTVAEGSAKAWMHLDGSATFDGSDTEIKESFNITTTTDEGTGYYAYAFVSAFSNANFLETYGTGQDEIRLEIANRTASASGVRVQGSDGTLTDNGYVMTAAHGDLA